MNKPDSETSIRVLFLDHTAQPGGGEIALLELLASLDRVSVHPVVVLFAEGPLVNRFREHAETHVLPMSQALSGAAKDSLGWRSLLRLRAMFSAGLQAWRVARFARRIQADLIHTNSLKSDVIGGVAGHLAGIPVIWHVRDRIEPDYLPALAVRVFRRLSRVVPHSIIANSQATLDSLHLENTAQPRGGARVIHDGCEPGLSRRSPVERATCVRIGLIGRISPWKGQHIFIEAAALLRARYPTARFEVIGAALFGEQEYEQRVRKLCISLGLAEVVQFTGFIEHVRLRIAELDLVVHASTIGEPFGQVIIEAMAEGKPVVATNGGGVPEIVVDGVTGLLVPTGDAPRMAGAIACLLDNPALAAAMGQRGRERVIAEFTIEGTARKVESLYADVLAVRRNETDDRRTSSGRDTLVG